MYPPSRLFVLFVLGARAVVGGGCDLFGSGDGDDGGTALPEGPAVVASMEGNGDNGSALWVFNAETLERTAVVETESSVPEALAFSPNYERWYLTWSRSVDSEGEPRNVRALLDATRGEITRRIAASGRSVADGRLIYEPINDHVVGYGDSLEFFDPETLELVREQSIRERNDFVFDAALAEGRRTLYFAAERRIYVYDAAEQEISSTIPAPRPGLVDVAVSPDERYLYATTWEGQGTPGRFHMVDLETGEPVFEGGPVGKNASLAVGPDGRYVYVDCPAGGRLAIEVEPTNQVIRFDVKTRELEVFIDGGRDLGLKQDGLEAEQITMLPSGDAFVIRRPFPARIQQESEEVGPSLFVVETDTGAVRATYTLPRNEEGSVENYVFTLDAATVPGR